MFLESPIGLLALLGIPLVFWLHRLRQSPKKQNVDSLYLWKKLEHYLGSKPLRKASHIYLILILQVLAVIFLSLALAKPVWQVNKPQPGSLIFLIDNSASLGTRNTDGISRLEALKMNIKKIIGMVSKDSAISYYDGNSTFIELSIQDALNQLDKLELMEIPSDIVKLVAWAKGVKGEIYFCSDRMPPESVIKELGRQPRFVLVGAASHNLAIIRSAATARDDKPDYYDVFAVIRDYTQGTKEKNVQVELAEQLKDGINPIARQNINIKAGGENSVIFNNLYWAQDRIWKLSVFPDDEMSCDNSIWLMPMDIKIVFSIIGSGSPALVKAVESITSLSVSNSKDHLIDARSFTRIIFNETELKSAPEKGVIINCTTAGDSVDTEGVRWKYEGRIDSPKITEADLTSPILQYCDLETLNNIPYAQKLSPVEEEYFKPIIKAKGANNENCVLLGEWQKDKQHLIIINFPIEWRTANSPNDWSATPTFPVFWTNLINYLYPRLGPEYALERTNSNSRTGLAPWSIMGYKDIYLSLADEQESDNNGITLIDDSLPRDSSELMAGRVRISNWLIGLALILLLAAWALRYSR